MSEYYFVTYVEKRHSTAVHNTLVEDHPLYWLSWYYKQFEIRPIILFYAEISEELYMEYTEDFE